MVQVSLLSSTLKICIVVNGVMFPERCKMRDAIQLEVVSL